MDLTLRFKMKLCDTFADFAHVAVNVFLNAKVLRLEVGVVVVALSFWLLEIRRVVYLRTQRPLRGAIQNHGGSEVIWLHRKNGFAAAIPLRSLRRCGKKTRDC